jgi:uncharacterized protein (TIGR03118 family)
MKPTLKNFSRLISIVLCFSILLISCQKTVQPADKSIQPSVAGKDPQALKDFIVTNLVANNDEYNAAFVVPNLQNAWGITFPTSGPAWVNAEVTGKSYLFNGDGTQPGISPISVPGPLGVDVGHPTGIVFNSSSDFKLPNNNPARFIFAGDDGVISGWNGGSTAVRKIDDSHEGAAYFGVAIANDGTGNFLYVANFAEKEIAVYDKNWVEVHNKLFSDPNLPADYSPFNIIGIDNKLYVMYAKQGPGGDEIHHPGFGIVDIFNADGTLMKRFVSNGQLNSPWGFAKAPAGFWGADAEINGDVYLVGNFGDGHINAYDSNGDFLGQLRQSGEPIVIDGLWGIAFAPSTSTAINHNRLYFAAGPDDETDGLFGYISK